MPTRTRIPRGSARATGREVSTPSPHRRATCFPATSTCTGSVVPNAPVTVYDQLLDGEDRIGRGRADGLGGQVDGDDAVGVCDGRREGTTGGPGVAVLRHRARRGGEQGRDGGGPRIGVDRHPAELAGEPQAGRGVGDVVERYRPLRRRLLGASRALSRTGRPTARPEPRRRPSRSHTRPAGPLRSRAPPEPGPSPGPAHRCHRDHLPVQRARPGKPRRRTRRTRPGNHLVRGRAGAAHRSSQRVGITRRENKLLVHSKLSRVWLYYASSSGARYRGGHRGRARRRRRRTRPCLPARDPPPRGQRPPRPRAGSPARRG